MLPHAGYVYSGMVAARTVARVIIKDTVVLFGPNHTGLGAAFSIMAEGVWQTPIGDVSIDSGLAEEILKKSSYLEKDEMAHIYEHSLEVQLPILQYFRKNFKIVPIVFGGDDFNALVEVGNAVSSALKEARCQRNAILVASSDMTHYEPAVIARKKDEAALQAVLALDSKGLWQTVKAHGITMCGYMPVIAMIVAAKGLGASKAQMVQYATSGDVTGDNSSVVGYAGVIVY